MIVLDSEGERKWSKAVAGDINWAPVLSLEGVVYVTADDDAVYAFSLADGSKLWKFETREVLE